jgi:UDP-N-acetylmuramate dehydrogenase
MFFPQDEADLQYFLKHKPEEMPFFVLGSGSNLLIRDGGIRGAVIKLKNKNFCGCKVVGDKLYCGAGLKNYDLKKVLLTHKIGSLEFLCSIPGCIGGAVRSNAGCFGSSLSSVLVSSRVMNAKGDIFDVPATEFHFGYRKSEFPSDWIILELVFKTVKSTAQQVNQTITEQAEYRRTHQPQNIRTAGSTFKNPPQSAAWKLIKAVGGDTLKIGGASFSPQHCNFLVNDGTASAEDIETLGNTVIEKVKKQENISLVWEVKIIGKHKK